MAEDIKLAFEFMLYNSSFPTIGALISHHIPEKLQNTPKTAEELSESTNINPSRLFRYLRIASYFGIFTLDQETNKWSNTSKSLILMTSFSQALWKFYSHQHLLEHYEHSLSALTSTKPVREIMNLNPFFEAIGANPELLQLFQTMMSERNEFLLPNILECVNIDKIGSILDVGGGDGSLILGFVKKYPHIKGAVFERPELAELVLKNINSQGLSDQVHFHAGDFFESVPNGFDCIILKRIICAFTDDKAEEILKNCRKALITGSRLIIIGMVIDEKSEYYNGTLAYDHLMMLLLDSNVRSISELEKMMNSNEFRLTGIKKCGFETIVEGEAC